MQVSLQKSTHGLEKKMSLVPGYTRVYYMYTTVQIVYQTMI